MRADEVRVDDRFVDENPDLGYTVTGVLPPFDGNVSYFVRTDKGDRDVRTYKVGAEVPLVRPPARS